MGWKNWPYWLRGGIITIAILLIIQIILSLTGLLLFVALIMGNTLSNLLLPVVMFMGIEPLNYFWSIFSIVFQFVIGALIGWLYGKFKKSKGKRNMLMRKSKKAAIELSMGTIVVLVLAMSMLILGLVLVRTIFTGAKYNVQQINQKVESEINRLFSEDKKIVVHLADNKADMKPGETFGVAFGVKNVIRGGEENPKFKYEVSMDESSCKSLKEKEAMSWIKLGKEGEISLAYDQTKVWLVRFEIPENAPGCMVRYNIEIKAAGQLYASESFDVNIISKN